MRIISPPIHEMPLRPVEASQGIRNRVSRDAVPDASHAGQKAADNAGSASGARDVAAARAMDGVARSGNSAIVGASVSAQKVFHAVYGGPAEASLPDANRAYTKTDSLRFKDVPFTMRVV
jgi:hypothetical protein